MCQSELLQLIIFESNCYFCWQGVASQVGESLGIKVKLLTGGGTKKRMLTPPMAQHDLMVASFGVLSKLTTVGKIVQYLSAFQIPWGLQQQTKVLRQL